MDKQDFIQVNHLNMTFLKVKCCSFFSKEGKWKPLKFFVALLPLALAAFITVSRVVDYRHHPADIIAGALIGVFVSNLVYHLYWPILSSSTSFLPTKRVEEDLEYASITNHRLTEEI